jgi:hypothetical protein
MSDSYPRTLIVTSCTGDKRFKPSRQLKLEDFKSLELLQERSQELADYICPAVDLYTGVQHLRLMEGIKLLRESFDKNIVDVVVISAGYGLINEEAMIAPYEVTFNTMKGHEIDEWSSFLNIHKDFEDIVANYDLIFVLLGDKYLRAISLPIKTNENQLFVFLASRGSVKYIQRLKAKKFIFKLSNIEARHYRYGLVGLKGFLFKSFAESINGDINLLNKVYENPEVFKTIVDQKNNSKQLEIPLEIEEKLKLNYNNTAINKKVNKSISSEFIKIPNLPIAPNRHLGMQYFIPEWDDHVDPNYDFTNDILTPGRDTYKDEVYAHEIFEKPNYDGILVSKIVVENTKKKKAMIEKDGIHKFIRFNGKVMGDCGAFGYVKEDVPPYKTEEILEYYENFGFDLGISIDHLIVGPFAAPGIREERYDLTMKNAELFLNKHSEGGYTFTPIGAIQGWSPETYVEAFKAYVEMGYKYVAIGGVARATSQQIIEILTAIHPHIKPDIKIHLLGVARYNAIPAFRHLGITSFDSASPLRRAWLGSGKNYDALSGNHYAAIRVPPVTRHGVRVRRLLEAGVADQATLQSLEQKTLNALRKYNVGDLGLEETLQIVLNYDELVELPRDGVADPEAQAKRRVKHEIMYRQVLQDTPWKECDCIICNDISIEVMIFRGNDRNRRRGFHNTYVFYNRFQSLLKKLNAQES